MVASTAAGRTEIVIRDVERSVFAGEHAEGKKGEQHGGTDAPRKQPSQNAEQPKRAAKQYKLVRLGHRRMAEGDQLCTRHIVDS
jgi:hypothetical protein